MSRVVHYARQTLPVDSSTPLRTLCGFFSDSVTRDPREVTCRTCKRLVQPLLAAPTPTRKPEKPTMRTTISVAFLYIAATLAAACGTPVETTTTTATDGSSTGTGVDTSAGPEPVTTTEIADASSSTGEDLSTSTGSPTTTTSTSGAGTLDDTSTSSTAAATTSTGEDSSTSTSTGESTTGEDPSTSGTTDGESGTTGPNTMAPCFATPCDADVEFACPLGLVCAHHPNSWKATCTGAGPCELGLPCEIDEGLLCGYPPVTECRLDLDNNEARCFAVPCDDDTPCSVGICADGACFLI